jgi:hypothetical protein
MRPLLRSGLLALAALGLACGGSFAAAPDGVPGPAGPEPGSDAPPVAPVGRPDAAAPALDARAPADAASEAIGIDAPAHDAGTRPTDAAPETSTTCPVSLVAASGSCSAPGEQCAYPEGACACVTSCEVLIPQTCRQQGFNCGIAGDTAGGIIDCGTCVAPGVCAGNVCTGEAGSGTPPCTPTTCAARGVTCGVIDDGCGGALSCGYCTQWVCASTAAGCPASAPDAGSACEAEGLSCAYDPGPCGEVMMQCSAGAWASVVANQ